MNLHNKILCHFKLYYVLLCSEVGSWLTDFDLIFSIDYEILHQSEYNLTSNILYILMYVL